MDSHIRKPFSSHDLIRVLDQFIGTTRESSTGMPGGYAQGSESEVLSVSTFEEFRTIGASTGNPNILVEIIHSYMSETSKSLLELAAVIAEEVPERVERIAHSIKSSSGQIGVARVAEIAARLESESKGGDLVLADAHLEALTYEFDQACEALRIQVLEVDETSSSSDSDVLPGSVEEAETER